MANRMKQLLSSIAPSRVSAGNVQVSGPQMPTLYGDTLAAQVKLSNANLSNAQAALNSSKATNLSLGTMMGPEPVVTQPGGSSYFDKLKMVESHGKYNAVNKGSGATGAYQFLPGTASPYLKKLGKTWNDFKSDPKLQDTVAAMFTRDIDNRLKKYNLPITDINRYALHQQGLGGGINMLTGKPVSQINLTSNNVNSPSAWFSKFGPLFR